MESFAKNMISRPLKLSAFCMALYLASQSFIVGVFFAAVGFFYLKEKVLQWGKAVPAAPKVSMPEHDSKRKPTNDQVAESPEQKYARSAVVTPIRRTGTHDRS
ncbi:hypothetical protein [Cupriavidus consociatus]|uniref:hypothetical protein n=1 Tax=Cupriavidus consociatus TaxID=2821357 RepID=UPI001AE2DADE|nr:MULTISPECIES: hypothetical protein [unclassified Cupriavidus]MBP0624748.1 hypothetical protein [Cupriavidus sp. LEh25]MDK2661464.1 hypothetical protein [Cupriavidus sp. LEh21]